MNDNNEHNELERRAERGGREERRWRGEEKRGEHGKSHGSHTQGENLYMKSL